MSTLREMIRSTPVTVDSSMTVRQAADVLRERHVPIAPVLHHGRAVGVVWKDDLAMFAPIRGEVMPFSLELERVLVQDIMCLPVPSLSLEAEVSEAESILRRSGDRHLLVMDGDLLVGFVSGDELARRRVD